RHYDDREGFLADRRLWRGRGLRYRHLRRDRARARGRRPPAGLPRPDGRAVADTLCRARRAGHRGAAASVTLRIAMWSGPRNLSTAMMRSFGSRRDTYVSDEPFYGAFLKTTGLDHPMRDETIAAVDCDWSSVMASLRGSPAEDR